MKKILDKILKNRGTNMKKILPIIVIGILVLSGLGAATITEDNQEEYISETILLSEPTVQEKEDYVSLELPEATAQSWEKDKPTLPVVTKVYTFPFGTRIDTVEVTFSDVIEQEIAKPIMPSPELHIYSTEYISSTNREHEKILTYSDLPAYPDTQWGYRTGAGLQDEEHVIYLTVHLYPTQYHPQTNKLYSSKKATIDITYTPPENPVIFKEVYDLLIITPKAFETALQPLIDHKNSIGIETTLTTLEDIPSTGVDEQESIKYYIKDAIETWGITYVLLVGAGVKGKEIFPVRYAWVPSGGNEQYFPSDLYFADIYNETMEFSNWDKDGDGRFAEYPADIPNVDVFPDVYLGKLPCNDAGEVSDVVNKIINYKAHNKMTNKILQLGGDSVPGDSIYEGEYANEKVLEKLPGYTSTQLWGSNGQLTKQNIAKGFKSNVDFVDISGHGSYASWATHPPNDESIWIPEKTLISPYAGFLYYEYDLYRINNAQKLPVVVFTACSNNKYTESATSIGWTTVSKANGGGIASFAESGMGHGPGGTAFVQHNIGWMEVKIFEELYNTKILGQAWANSVTEYYYTFESGLNLADYKTMLEFSMFGDPTLSIEDGDDPESIPMLKNQRQRLSVLFFDIIEQYFPRLYMIIETIINFDR